MYKRRLPERTTRRRIRRAFEAAAALIFVSGILTVLLWPTPVDRPLYVKLLRAVNRLQDQGLSGISYEFLEASANVALFVPLGFVAARILHPRRWWLALLLCTALSVAGELAQDLFLPNRIGNAQDVLLNSAGALIGILLAALLHFATRLGARRRERRKERRAARRSAQRELRREAPA